MSDRIIVRQLRAIRDLVDNTLELMGDEVEQLPDEPCAHPKDSRRAAAVMGSPERFLCMKCQTFVNDESAPPAPSAEPPGA